MVIDPLGLLGDITASGVTSQAYAQQQRLHDAWAMQNAVTHFAPSDLQNIAPASREPLDPTDDSTFELWLLVDDGRTIEEFAAAAELPNG
jgi:hypothetical protein